MHMSNLTFPGDIGNLDGGTDCGRLADLTPREARAARRNIVRSANELIETSPRDSDLTELSDAKTKTKTRKTKSKTVNKTQKVKLDEARLDFSPRLWLGSCLVSLIWPCPYFSCFVYAHLLFFAHWF